ncbi:hypothetical protein A2U01_0073342, partial [Trifolium medium]|nr:hypothetical protein [Trifolium medium]
ATSGKKTSGSMTRKEMIADLMGHMQVENLGGKRPLSTPPKREGGCNCQDQK